MPSPHSSWSRRLSHSPPSSGALLYASFSPWCPSVLSSSVSSVTSREAGSDTNVGSARTSQTAFFFHSPATCPFLPHAIPLLTFRRFPPIPGASDECKEPGRLRLGPPSTLLIEPPPPPPLPFLPPPSPPLPPPVDGRRLNASNSLSSPPRPAGDSTAPPPPSASRLSATSSPLEPAARGCSSIARWAEPRCGAGKTSGGSSTCGRE